MRARLHWQVVKFNVQDGQAVQLANADGARYNDMSFDRPGTALGCTCSMPASFDKDREPVVKFHCTSSGEELWRVENSELIGFLTTKRLAVVSDESSYDAAQVVDYTQKVRLQVLRGLQRCVHSLDGFDWLLLDRFIYDHNNGLKLSFLDVARGEVAACHSILLSGVFQMPKSPDEGTLAVEHHGWDNSGRLHCVSLFKLF